MKGLQMKPDTKLLQVFLSPKDSPTPVISEVYLGPKEKLICTCPGYRGRSSCKHIIFVKKRIEDHDGNYPLAVAKGAPKTEVEKAMTSPENFRKFVVAYGKIEVH